ncbi:MAG: Sb-PDE family phosphodiesterase [Pseudomonadales bacterium]
MIDRVGVLLLLATASAVCLGHGTADLPAAAEARRIEFPDTDRYLTLVLDPHTHSVFSDGHVWPRIRIGEALLDGLDAIAITEHLEYQPHLADIPHPDRNRAYAEAVSAAAGTDLMVIAGSEITREAPAGHINAIFIDDANALFRAETPEDPADVRSYYVQAGEWPAQAAVQAANDQGAFVFWNHPYWSRDFANGIPVIPEFHVGNARNGLLHGVEIANGDDYSEETFRIALDHDLTLIGVSDVHELIDWDYPPHAGGHRPVTLVFAEARTPEALRAALFDGRTVVWFKNLLIGRSEHLNPLLAASLSIEAAAYEGNAQVLTVALRNRSDADLQLMNRGALTFFDDADLIEVAAHSVRKLRVKTGVRVPRIELDFDVVNALIAPKQPAAIRLSADVTGARVN